MPWTSFIANGLWVLVIGLMGPSVPFIIEEFSIDYSRAGLIFTILSVSSFFGTFIGGWVSDYRRRKLFWMIFLAVLTAGLILFGQVSSFLMLLLIVLFMSLFGSPIGAVGQSIMLQMFPEKRGRYVSLSTMSAATGSFLAPILISLACLAGMGWKTAFLVAAGAAFTLFVIVAGLKLPAPEASGKKWSDVFKLFTDKKIVFSGIMIFFCVGFDLGFSYWLAEYFVRYSGTAAELSGFAVGFYLVGVILGRFLNSRRPEAAGFWLLPSIGLALAAVSLVLFLNTSVIQIKLVFCFTYGLGIGPAFPSMMALGTSHYPHRPGAATAVLYSMMSLSGAVFPFIIGTIGRSFGIQQAYYALLLIMIPFVAGILIRKRFL